MLPPVTFVNCCNTSPATTEPEVTVKERHPSTSKLGKDDVKNVIKLIYHTLLNLEENHNFKYNA